MMPAEPTSPSAPSWLQPAPEYLGLKRYLETVRERLSLVALCVVLCVGAALLYLLSADRVYEARADLLITPVAADSTTFANLGLLRESNDPAREVDTATQLITTISVAERLSGDTSGSPSARELLERVEALPVAQSNIVALTAEGDSPTAASELANDFARAAIDERTQALHARIDDLLPDLRAELETLPPGSITAEETGTQIADLEALQAGPDPTISLASAASPPDSASGPSAVLIIVGAGLIGLVLGLIAAFAVRVLDPRLRREEQLRELFQLPILARVPEEPSRGKGPLARDQLSAAAGEAYRTLRTTLLAGIRTSGPCSILITGPSAGGGKTTTAVNLATTLATAGRDVILIEADLRRPSIASTLGLETSQGLVSVLTEENTLEDALVPARVYGGSLHVLLADVTGPSVAELIPSPITRQLIDDAKQLADYVVIDSPPLTEVIDALPLVGYVDEVVMVLRLGHSGLRNSKEFGELIAGAGGTPAGIALLGVERRGREYSYYQSPPEESKTGNGRWRGRASRNRRSGSRRERDEAASTTERSGP